MWNIVCMTFKHVMDCNLPVEVFAYKPPKGTGKKGSPPTAAKGQAEPAPNPSAEEKPEDQRANTGQMERHHSGSTEFLLQETVRRGILPVAVLQVRNGPRARGGVLLRRLTGRDRCVVGVVCHR